MKCAERPITHPKNTSSCARRGPASCTIEYRSAFVRIDAISKNEKGDLGADTKGALLLLDLLDRRVRNVVRASASAAEAYKNAGVTYE